MIELHCIHDWEELETWEGDDSIPNGKHYITYYKCSQCGEEQDEEPSDFEPDDGSDYGDYLYDQQKDDRMMAKWESEQ